MRILVGVILLLLHFFFFKFYFTPFADIVNKILAIANYQAG